MKVIRQFAAERHGFSSSKKRTKNKTPILLPNKKKRKKKLTEQYVELQIFNPSLEQKEEAFVTGLDIGEQRVSSEPEESKKQNVISVKVECRESQKF